MRTKPSSRSELPDREGGFTQLERHVPAYRQYLLDRGNAAGYGRSCEAAVMHLSMWMRQGNRRLTDIDEALVVEFLDGHLPHTRSHLLRHTMASRLLAGGSSLKEVADVLRHRSLNTTLIYAKLDSGTRRRRCVLHRDAGPPVRQANERSPGGARLRHAAQ